MDWMKLRSGSDVRGKAVGEDALLTNEVAHQLGMAFARYTAEKAGKEKVTIAFGRDSRITGEALLKAAAQGAMEAGADVIDFGMCTTPAMYMSILDPDFAPDGAVMVTASHHPWDRNGLKFFLQNGGLESSEVAHLLETAPGMTAGDTCGTCTFRPFLPSYKKLLADRIRKGLGTDAEKPLAGLHIAVDAGNGAGGFYADLMGELGADTDGSQFLDADGYFPNHIPNPENETAMQSISAAVVKAKADLGVIFDADCDRAAVVDADGREINRNRLIALISAILLEDHPGQTIVTDSVTSSGLKKFIAAKGGTHYRFKRGYRNVIDEAIRLNGEGIPTPLAIETSGHAALQENHFLDDGMYLVTVLIVRAMQMKKQGKTLGSVIADLQEPVESREIRMSITAENFRPAGQKAIDRLLEKAAKDPEWHLADDNREGVRISFDMNDVKDAGWILLRLSVHDPVLPLNAESDVPGGVMTMLKKLYATLEGIADVDLTNLAQAVQA